jgi:hypothetical protein
MNFETEDEKLRTTLLVTLNLCNGSLHESIGLKALPQKNIDQKKLHPIDIIDPYGGRSQLPPNPGLTLY